MKFASTTCFLFLAAFHFVAIGGFSLQTLVRPNAKTYYIHPSTRQQVRRTAVRSPVMQTGWSRPGQLGPTVAQLAKQKKLLGLGGLKKLPRVFPADELVNRAVNRALSHKEDTTVKNQRQRARKYAAEQLAILSKELTKPTGEILEGYEKILKNLSPFEKVVADLTVKSRELAGYGSLPDTLKGLQELRKDTMEVCKAGTKAAKEAVSRKLTLEEVDVAIASIEELWERDGWVLDLLLNMGQELRSVPMVDPELDTVVLVGSPNVGKSSIVRSISTGTPEVNNYPFTTRGMTLGHILDDLGEQICQVMDTPGLLPRSDQERNEMEKLTLASMEHLNSVIIFVLDLTGESGIKSSISDQLSVRDELRIRFPDREWIDVVSKADIPLEPQCEQKVPEGALRISSTTQEGMEVLSARVMQSLQTLQEKREARERERSRFIY